MGRESQVFRKHTLVRICGNVRDIQGTRSVVAFRIFPVHDFNEFSCHILEVIHSQMLYQVLEKGAGGSVIGGNDTSVASSTATAASTSTGPALVKGLSNVQNQVLKSIQSFSHKESGPSVTEIRGSLGHGISEVQIRDAIDYLSNEGHIYSTLDEDHYRATDA